MSLLLFAHSEDPARLRSLASLVAAAAAAGREVTVIWEAGALARLAQGGLDAEGPSGLPSPGELLSEARRLGGVRFLACPTAIVAAGVDEDAARAAVDEVLGLTSIVELAEAASTTLFI